MLERTHGVQRRMSRAGGQPEKEGWEMRLEGGQGQIGWVLCAC